MVFNVINNTYTCERCFYSVRSISRVCWLYVIEYVDYGRAVAGKPKFTITSVTGFAQIEVKYSEAYLSVRRIDGDETALWLMRTWSGLEKPQGDGPFAFANSLAAIFQVETFNITHIGELEVFLVFRVRKDGSQYDLCENPA